MISLLSSYLTYAFFFPAESLVLLFLLLATSSPVSQGFEKVLSSQQQQQQQHYLDQSQQQRQRQLPSQLPIITTKPRTFRIPEEHTVVLPCEVESIGEDKILLPY